VSNSYSIRIGRDQHGPDVTVQQATVNLFADSRIYAATLQEDLVPSLPSDDRVAPSSKITECYVVAEDGSIVCHGLASDNALGGSTLGAVAAVEMATSTVSSPTDALVWHPAHIDRIHATTNFTYACPLSSLGDAATGSGLYVYSRAVDDSGNLEEPAQPFGPLHA
jgi:phage baseplate assembly protein gpV